MSLLTGCTPTLPAQIPRRRSSFCLASQRRVAAPRGQREALALHSAWGALPFPGRSLCCYFTLLLNWYQACLSASAASCFPIKTHDSR